MSSPGVALPGGNGSAAHQRPLQPVPWVFAPGIRLTAVALSLLAPSQAAPDELRVPEDEVGHMLRAALFRRQLSPAQRAALALEFEGYAQVRAHAQERRLVNLSRPPRPGHPGRTAKRGLTKT